MKYFGLKFSVTATLIISACLVTVMVRAEDKECYDCHKEARQRFQKEFVHPPVEDEDCSACHEDHGESNSLKLTAEAPELCADCHDLDDDDLKSAHKNYPLGEANCYSCHNPHASDNEKLIRTVQHSPFEDRDCESCHGEPQDKIETIEDGAKLCYECHDAKNDKKNVHPPVEDGECTSCHSPHASDNDKQLIFKGGDLCYQCHDRKDDKAVVHKPVAEGLCVKCHNPHSSDNDFFLVKPFPKSFYPPYKKGIYALCAICHKDTVSNLAQRYGAKTGFIRNNENLHARHVNNKKKGRNCKACHDVHSGDQEKQIRNEVPFGRRYKYPFKYTKFKDKKGGRCVVGCHKPRVYGPAVIQGSN